MTQAIVREGLKKILKGQFEDRFNLNLTETIPNDRDNYLVITNMPSLNNETDNMCVVESPLGYGDFQLIEKKLNSKLQEMYQASNNN